MDVPRDVQEFLDGYPSLRKRDDKNITANQDFYSGKRNCSPDNVSIEHIHKKWKGDYDTLEFNHGYIQWLFPIREHGMNYQAEPLQLHELAVMKGDPRVLERLLASYRLMLDFYGMKLVSSDTGEIERSHNYKERYANLIKKSHNYLRISRIFKCLSEFGFERLNAGFLLHVLNEQSEKRGLNEDPQSAKWDLNAPTTRHGLPSSMDRWWANCIRNQEEREWVGGIITKVRRDEEYVFTREMYMAALERRSRTGSFRSEGMKVEL